MGDYIMGRYFPLRTTYVAYALGTPWTPEAGAYPHAAA